MGTYLFSCRNGEKSHYTPGAGSAMALPFLQYIVVAMCREKAAKSRN